MGVNTHAFPYEPGFVLWPEVGEFPESGGLVSSSGPLYIDGQLSSSLGSCNYIIGDPKFVQALMTVGGRFGGRPNFFWNIYISSQGTALFYVNAARLSTQTTYTFIKLPQGALPSGTSITKRGM